MTCKDLIGYQLVSIDDEKIVVRKNGTEYILHIREDYGDCCGYNEITTKLLISETELHRNPIITNVEVTEDLGEYDGASGKIAFFGEYKPMAEVETYSSSGSGWQYGACVWIECEALEISETVSSW